MRHPLDLWQVHADEQEPPPDESRNAEAEALVNRIATVSHAQLGAETLEQGCAICMSAYEPEDRIVQMSGCAHLFHKGCVKQWFSKCPNEPSCPFCREQIQPSI